VLRSFLKLIKHREIRTDDNHAAFVIDENLENFSQSCLHSKISKVCAYYRIK